MGSLAAGSAAAMGTGAFETAEADRAVDVNVAPDSNGFVKIRPLDERYASYDGGQLVLNFDEDSGLGIFDGDAQGLNPDSKFSFGEVFRIANITSGDAYVVIETSLPTSDKITLTADGEDANAISAGTSLMARDYDDVDNLPKLVEPDNVDVDVHIETGSSLGEMEGEMTIYVAKGGNRDQLADVL